MIEKIQQELPDEKIWTDLGFGVLKLLLIFILSRLIIRLSRTIIRKYFIVRSGSPIRSKVRRETTLLRLLQNVITYVVNFVALTMVLEVFGLNVKALLAGAGIVGLAIGFGAQSLVKDIITGFFIILEDQFSVGDQIKIKDFEGEVLEIGLRTTKIKSYTGQLHVIPNGNIMEVTNYSVLNSKAIVDITLPFNGEIETAETALTDMLASLPDKYEELIGAPEVLGVESLSTSEIVLRITAETKPNCSAAMTRALRKEAMDCMAQFEWLREN